MNREFGLLTFLLVLVLFVKPVFSGDETYLRIANEWSESYSSSAPWLDSLDINELAGYVEKRMVTGKLRPEIEAVEALQSKKASRTFFIVPVTSDEREYAINWERISFSSPAQFLPEVRSIMLDADARYSHLGKAIALSREYYRARAILEKKYDSYWHMEADAQAFQNKFMWFLGGENYINLVYGEAKKIIELAKKDKKIFLSEPTFYDERLTSIFGKPESRDEELYIQRVIWIHSVFIFIENTAKKGYVGKEKAELIKALDFYKEGEYQRKSLELPTHEAVSVKK